MLRPVNLAVGNPPVFIFVTIRWFLLIIEIKAVAALLGVSGVSLYRGLSTKTKNVRGQILRSLCDAATVSTIFLLLQFLQMVSSQRGRRKKDEGEGWGRKALKEKGRGSLSFSTQPYALIDCARKSSIIDLLSLYVLFSQKRSQGNLALCLFINYAQICT